MELKYIGFKNKLTGFIESLAIGEKDLRERFIPVALDMCAIHNDEIHPDYIENWEEIIKDLTYKGPEISTTRREISGSIENTIKKSQNRKLSKIVQKMIDLKYEYN